jgi:hypothetical protein
MSVLGDLTVAPITSTIRDISVEQIRAALLFALGFREHA